MSVKTPGDVLLFVKKRT